MVPNLARSIPEPADGGRTYTFQLRPGIRYSSGDPVRPEDFRRAIERVYSLDSPEPGYFDTIVGADECLRGEPCDLSAGIETDDDAGTVTFHLVEPDPDFLNKLTMPFAFAVPAGTPDTARPPRHRHHRSPPPARTRSSDTPWVRRKGR